jgi:Helix-turn-helix domain
MHSISIPTADEIIEKMKPVMENLFKTYLGSIQAPKSEDSDSFDIIHQDAARRLGIAESTLYGVTARGEIDFKKKGKRNYYSPKSIADFISSGGKISPAKTK